MEGCIQDDQLDLSKSLVESTLKKQANSKYPLRGPHLMKVELVAHLVRTNGTDESVNALAAVIQEYGELFCPRAVCAFSDLESYVELVASSEVPTTKTAIESLLRFSETIRKANMSPNEGDNVSNKERQSRLRSYIFAIKMNHKLLALHTDFQDRWLPEWSELVTEWQATLSLSSSNDGEEVSQDEKPLQLLSINVAHF